MMNQTPIVKLLSWKIVLSHSKASVDQPVKMGTNIHLPHNERKTHRGFSVTDI
jgi:hypothetical protein